MQTYKIAVVAGDGIGPRAARKIESAVALAPVDGRFRTVDIGGPASTKEVTSAILAHLVEK